MRNKVSAPKFSHNQIINYPTTSHFVIDRSPHALPTLHLMAVRNLKLETTLSTYLLHVFVAKAILEANSWFPRVMAVKDYMLACVYLLSFKYDCTLNSDWPARCGSFSESLEAKQAHHRLRCHCQSPTGRLRGAAASMSNIILLPSYRVPTHTPRIVLRTTAEIPRRPQPTFGPVDPAPWYSP